MLQENLCIGGLPTMYTQGIGIYRELKEMRGILTLNTVISIQKEMLLSALDIHILERCSFSMKATT